MSACTVVFLSSRYRILCVRARSLHAAFALSHLLCPHSLNITQDGALRPARSISAVPTTKIPTAIVPQSGSSPRDSGPAADVLADLGRNLAGSKSHCVPTTHINSFTMVHATPHNATLRCRRLTRLSYASVGERIALQLRLPVSCMYYCRSR